MLAARLLAELGDDRDRFTSARGPRAFAGTAPITRASGTTRGVFARRVRNRRLAQLTYQWAFSLLTASPGARAHYDQRRERQDRYSAAGRRLASRHLSIAWHCLQTRQMHDEDSAYPTAGAAAL